MKKLLSILLLVSLSLLSISFMVMAEGESSQTVSNDTAAGSSGSNLYIDYSIINWIPNTPNQQINFLTAGIDYDQDSLVLGAFYSTALSYNPDSPDESTNSYMVYGGYDILAQDQASLGIIASYNSYTNKFSGAGGDSTTASSIGIGLKGSLNFGSGNISLLYSYGVSNQISHTPDGDVTTDFTGTKVNMSYGEVKGVYYFSDTVGIHAVYRYMTYADPDDAFTKQEFSGFGLGVDFKF